MKAKTWLFFVYIFRLGVIKMSKKTVREILDELEEQFHKGVESRYGDYLEIFVNPDIDEIRDLKKKSDVVRFIAVKKEKKVYVSNSTLLHREMVRKADIGRGSKNEVIFNFSALGDIEGNKILVTHLSDGFRFSENSNELEALCYEISSGKFDWLEKYNFDLSKIKPWAEDKLEELRLDWELYLESRDS